LRSRATSGGAIVGGAALKIVQPTGNTAKLLLIDGLAAPEDF
jgi:hypothetical protein